MELSEAKERVKDLINASAMGIILHPNDKDLFSCDKEALETVLKALHEDELIIDRVKNIKDRLAYDITYNWDNALDDLRRMLGV